MLNTLQRLPLSTTKASLPHLRLSTTKTASLQAAGGRFLSSAALRLPKNHVASNSPSSLFSSKRLTQLSALGVGLGTAQLYLGEGNDIFEHEFVTTKKPEELAEFYGTEDFMQIFCVFPFVVDLMMRAATFDDDGTIHAWGMLGSGQLEVSVDFNEREVDTTGNGEPDTIEWFNKRESFHDVAPAFLGGFTLWEMTQNFGYHYENGKCTVYHHGEHFKGLFPIRLLFQMHANYVIWATQRYINSDAFGSEEQDELAEEMRQNVPLVVFKDFVQELTRAVQKAKDETKASDIKKQDKLEVTLKRLKTISSIDHKSTMPRLHTLRSHRTSLTRVHLEVDDKAANQTIRTAMEQIGSSEGQRHKPASELYKLAKHTTLMKKEDNDSA